MKLIVLFLSFAISSFGSDLEIKSRKAYPAGNETLPPIIRLDEKLTIEFDVESGSNPNLNLYFRFCDINWNIYENIFVENVDYNVERSLWLEKTNPDVVGSDFHYKGDFPNQNVLIQFPGKWKYFVTDYFDTSIVYSEGKFIVVSDEVSLELNLSRSRLEGKTFSNSTLGQSYELNTKAKLPDSLFSSKIIGLEIIENQKLSMPIFVSEDHQTEHRFIEWNGIDKLDYIIKDLRPGKENRQVDLRNHYKYQPPETRANYDGVDVSRLYSNSHKDFNGGSKILHFKNDYAEYMNVKFELRLANKPNKDVYLIGAFNDWRILPEYRMDLLDDLYFTYAELKRGIYDYYYISADADGSNIDLFEVEGNEWFTYNDYYVFLYYHTDELGGYDRIIGYNKFNNGDL